MATINDVAKRASVSTYTVSAVLNRSARVSPELTKRVLDAVRELDYTINSVARSLQTRTTQTIGMLLPNIANPFYAKLVRGAEEVCRRHNYSLLLGNTNESAEEQLRYLTVFRSKQVDGFLMCIAAGEEDDWAVLLEKKIPVVFTGRRPIMRDVDAVVADNELGTKLAVDHLLSKGHRRIGMLLGQETLSVSKERMIAWTASLVGAGVTPDLSCVKHGDWSAQRAYEQTLELLALDRPPTAMFTSNFLMLTGCLKALQETGVRVPERVQVMSSDDSEWLDVFEPKISAILQPSQQMGSLSAELLFDRLADPDRPTRQILLKPELKVR